MKVTTQQDQQESATTRIAPMPIDMGTNGSNQTPQGTPKHTISKVVKEAVNKVQRPKKKLSVRAARRRDNFNFLLRLHGVDEEEVLEDCGIFEDRLSPFSQLLQDEEKMKLWNDFINLTDADQAVILQGNKYENGDQSLEIEICNDDKDAEISSKHKDKRAVHPGFSAQACFSRIDQGIRRTLKKRNISKATLSHLEAELTDFFEEWPTSVYISHRDNKYERLMLHAVSQYLDLQSKSFDDKSSGIRHTHVENKHTYFRSPQVSLTDYLSKAH